jgi:hypothetical protein
VTRAIALLLLVALTGPQAAPLAAAAGSSAPVEAEVHHHHPPGCPWQGTPDCPHDHHGPSSQPTWSPCAEAPLAVAGEARMAWAPPEVASREAPAPAPAATVSFTGRQAPPSDSYLDIEIPPPRSIGAV